MSGVRVSGGCACEMRPYNEPLHTSEIGKRGYLRMGFELDASGRSILRDLERHTPLIVQQELYFDEGMPEMPCVYILSSGGPHVEGDRYEQEFTVRRNAFAHISTGAATKLAAMHRNHSALVQRIVLEEGAYLEYLPEPVIPCAHTRYHAVTSLRIDASATLVYAEIYACGRRYHAGGERFRYDILSVATRAERPDGNPLFRDKWIIRPALLHPDTVGVMNGYDLFANVVVLTPPEQAECLYERTEAFLDRREGLAVGVTRLPEGCGLCCKVLGRDTAAVKRQVRQIAGAVRRCIKGRALPDDFPWR